MLLLPKPAKTHNFEKLLNYLVRMNLKNCWKKDRQIWKGYLLNKHMRVLLFCSPQQVELLHINRLHVVKTSCLQNSCFTFSSLQQDSQQYHYQLALVPLWKYKSGLQTHFERGWIYRCLPIYAEFKNNKPHKQSPNIKKEINKSINTSNLVTK